MPWRYHSARTPSRVRTSLQGRGRGEEAKAAGLPATTAARSPGRAPDTAAGTRPVGAGQPRRRGGVVAKLPAERAPEASAATFRGSEAAPEGLAGTGERSEGLRLWRSLQSSRLLAAGTGRQRPPSLGLTKRKHPRSSARSPRRRGPPKGAGVARAGTPGGARQGRSTSCLGPRPGPIPESSKPLTRRASYPTASSEPSFHPSYPKRL